MNINNENIVIRIEIDCDPIIHQQEDIARYIFNWILKDKYREPNNTFFGCWTWCGVKCTREQQEEIKMLLTSEYEDGVVRYVSWGEEQWEN